MTAEGLEARWERLLGGKDSAARAALAQQLREDQPPPGETLDRAIRSADAGLRELVAWIAGGLPWTSAGTPLRRALEDAVPAVRRAAVLALAAQRGDEPAGLLGKAAADPDVEVATAAAIALMAYRGAAVEPLLTAARDQRPEVRSSALRSLAALHPRGDARVAGVARDALSAPDERVRAAACQLLGASGERADAEALRAVLADQSVAVRQCAEAAQRDLSARGA